MQMTAERYLAAPREAVWAALNDLKALRSSIPGCEALEWQGCETLKAEVRAKVGPVDARFRGKVTLRDRDPPNGYRIEGEGQGGAAGFASGFADVRLLPEGSGTLLRYRVEATIGGKLAQIGSRLIDAAAHKFADDFFERFARVVEPSPPALADESLPVVRVTRTGLRPMIWVPGLIALVALILLVFSRL